MKTSIVPELLNQKEIEFFDDNNVVMTVCKSSKFSLNSNYFRRPFIVIDNMEIGKYENIEIKKMFFPDLERLGLRLISIDLRGRRNMRNRTGQRSCYMIKRKTDPLEGAKELFKMPSDHILERDLTNNRVRIKGINSYPYIRNENSSRWFQI